MLDSDTTRKRANGWLLDNAGNLLLAGEPELVIGQQSVWRVPVILTSPSRGHVGMLGTLDLDATSGEILADSTTIEQFHARASELLPPQETPILRPADESFRAGWKEAQTGQTGSVSELWNEIDYGKRVRRS